MHLPYLKNLSETFVSVIEGPQTRALTTDLSKLSKSDYMDWATNRSTDHVFLSTYAGVEPALRVRKDENRAGVMFGLIADYDTPSRYEVEEGPNWVASTRTPGHKRLLWIFDRPVPCPLPAIMDRFLEIAMGKLKLDTLLPGLDKAAFLDPSRYYEVGHSWRQVEEEPLKSSQVESWMDEAMRTYERRGETIIPIEALRRECARQFPNTWPGGWDQIEFGDRGPRFWDPAAENPTTTILHEWGCYSFTGDVAAQSWGEILGWDFVGRYFETVIGEVVRDIWWDGRVYWLPNSQGEWFCMAKDDMKVHLRLQGLSPRAGRGEIASEVDQALARVWDRKRVHGTFPFLYAKEGPVTVRDKVYINIEKRSVLPPAELEEAPEWGEGFPMIAAFYDSWFDGASAPGSEEQKEAMAETQKKHFLAWLIHAYQCGLEQQPKQGAALFLVGPPNAFKNFHSDFILAPLLGAEKTEGDASNYLAGAEDQFNSELIKSPLWRLDDLAPPADRFKARQRFTMRLKATIANVGVVYRKMYADGTTMPWLGRVAATLNLDRTSFQALPLLDTGVKDKLLLLQVKSPDVWVGERPPVGQHAQDTQWWMDELRHFAAWLAGVEIPESLVDPRWGAKVYHNPGLLEAAREDTPEQFVEDALLAIVANHYDTEAEPLNMTTAQIYQALPEHGGDVRSVRMLSTILHSLMDRRKGVRYHRPRLGGTRKRLWEFGKAFLKQRK